MCIRSFPRMQCAWPLVQFQVNFWFWFEILQVYSFLCSYQQSGTLSTATSTGEAILIAPYNLSSLHIQMCSMHMCSMCVLCIYIIHTHILNCFVYVEYLSFLLITTQTKIQQDCLVGKGSLTTRFWFLELIPSCKERAFSTDLFPYLYLHTMAYMFLLPVTHTLHT